MTRAHWLPLACLLSTAGGCFVDQQGGGAELSSATEPPASATNGHSSANEPTTTAADPTTGATTEMTSAGSTGSTGSMVSATDPTNPTDPPGGGGSFCQEACRVDADCTASGMDLGYTCQDGRCATMGCTDDTACRAAFSGWVTKCADQADCPGQVCIDIGGGVGRCATAPSDFVTCEDILQEEIPMPAIEGSMDAIVCANTDYTCKDSVCVDPCEDDASCAMLPGHPTCNVETRVCECSSDADCKDSGVKGYAACHGGVCGCASDADCSDIRNADVCTDAGFCGCSSAAVCKDMAFDGTTPVCAAL